MNNTIRGILNGGSIISSVDEKKGLLSYDRLFKSVFINQENILGKMISDITGIDYELLKDNLILDVQEMPISRKNEKFKKCDFILRVEDNNIINLEINRQSHTGLIVKNLSYLFMLFSTSFSKGKAYNENLVVMQININCFSDSNGNIKALSKYHLREDDDGKLYAKNLVIYDLNVVKCHELYYNEEEKIPNYVRWGALIYCDDINKIPDIVKGIMTYEERNLIMEKLNKLTKEDLFMTEEAALRWVDWETNTIKNDAKKKGHEEGLKEGLKEGREEGREENIKITIEKMLSKNFSLDDISDITGKSIEEIKKYIG